MTGKAKITYLAHSGFAVETANHFFVFDYCQPSAKGPHNIAGGVITGTYLKEKRNIFVFASHSHADHFDRVILDWGKSIPDVTYVFSSDIHLRGPKESIRFMAPYQEYDKGGVVVKTFGSTDLGVSFLVQADGVSIFHAGDLNWWHWKGDNPEDRAGMEAAFKAEVEKIKPAEIDIAFFPVDPRLEEFYSLGADYFAEQLKPKMLVPMHFWGKYATTSAFAEKYRNSEMAAVALTHKGQEFEY